MEQGMDRPILLRIGGVCAIVGAIVSVAAGTGFGNRTTTWETTRLLSYLAARPAWYWPLVHLGFIVGAVLWVIAFRIIADTLPDGLSRSLGRLATVTIIFGAAIHIIDSSIDGVGLSAIARSWAAAPAADQPVILRTAAAVVDMIEGTWASVIALFHGLPFVLIGAAALISRRYPAWLGWVGIAGGIGSLALGVLMFLGTQVMLYIAGAIVVSVWMVAMGFLLWQRAEDAAAHS